MNELNAQSAVGSTRLVGPPRPGTIEPLQIWEVKCKLCHWKAESPTYDEASIRLTVHLDIDHKGWECNVRPNEQAHT
jgi:hypothetical protein